MSVNEKHIEPVWSNQTAPCGGLGGCPAYTNIAGALHALGKGDAGLAWRIMMESHPLRATLGRVCYGFCEKPCNRGQFDSPISIQMLEAVIGDNGYDPSFQPRKEKPNGKKVLIIGSGPCGLAAGWYLNIAGFKVDIFEAEEKAGGMLRYGIPSYRLDRKVLDREIKLIAKSGVSIHYGKCVSPKDVLKQVESGGYDAAIIAAGAGLSRKAGISGEDKALKGLDFLRSVNKGDLRQGHFRGKSVVVVGGGNVAMDACRSAVRLGAESVTVAYRRTEEMMPAHEHEVSLAREEGVEFSFLEAPESYDGKTVVMRKMALGQPDESGRRRPEPTGETAEYEADALITAIGQTWDKWDFGKAKNIYVGGDAHPEAEGTVIHAIASGKRIAEAINLSFAGKRLFEPLTEEVTYDKMNIHRYFTPQMRLRSRTEPVARRVRNFKPVERIVSLDEGVVEAQRCFRCGMCIGGLNSDCDLCFKACREEEGIEKIMAEWNTQGPFFARGNGCTACASCWEDCPRFAVRPEEVESE